MIVYVVSYRYSDGSGSGPVSVHYTKQGAEMMLEILNQQCDGVRQFAVAAVPCEPLP